MKRVQVYIGQFEYFVHQDFWLCRRLIRLKLKKCWEGLPCYWGVWNHTLKVQKVIRFSCRLVHWKRKNCRRVCISRDSNFYSTKFPLSNEWCVLLTFQLVYRSGEEEKAYKNGTAWWWERIFGRNRIIEIVSHFHLTLLQTHTVAFVYTHTTVKRKQK